MTAYQVRPMLAQYGSYLLLAIVFLIAFTPLGRGVGTVVNGLTDLLLGQ
jgi:hypothetical protein